MLAMELFVFSAAVCLFYAGTTTATRFERLFKYDNVKVETDNFSVSADSDIYDCAHACAHESQCFRFYYDPVTSTCELSSQLVLPDRQNGTATPGSRYYELQLASGPDWCPVDEGWKQTKGAPVCFKISKEMKNWEDARKECREQRGDLIVLEEIWKRSLILDEVKDIATKSNFLWVGLSDVDTEGEFKWVDGRIFSSTTFWFQQQPNGNDLENCGSLTDGKVYDSWCTNDNKFICEKLPMMA